MTKVSWLRLWLKSQREFVTWRVLPQSPGTCLWCSLLTGWVWWLGSPRSRASEMAAMGRVMGDGLEAPCDKDFPWQQGWGSTPFATCPKKSEFHCFSGASHRRKSRKVLSQATNITACWDTTTHSEDTLNARHCLPVADAQNWFEFSICIQHKTTALGILPHSPLSVLFLLHF